MKEEPYICPVCEKYEFNTIKDLGFNESCPYCGWQNDPYQYSHRDHKPGANTMSLNEARETYAHLFDVALMRVRFIGESDPLMLLHGKVYDVYAVEKEWYRIIDETEEDYLYPPEAFEIVEE